MIKKKNILTYLQGASIGNMFGALWSCHIWPSVNRLGPKHKTQENTVCEIYLTKGVHTSTVQANLTEMVKSKHKMQNSMKSPNAK